MRRLFAVMLTSICVAPAWGAQIERAPQKNAQGETLIMITGDITTGDADKFKKTIAGIADGTAAILLESHGGPALEGMAIGELLHLHKYQTAVVGDASCSSACGLIWLAGSPRYISSHAKVGFHAAYKQNTLEESGVGNALVGSYLTGLGFSYDVIAYATSAAPESMKWLSRADANKLHIAYEMVEGEDNSFGRGVLAGSDWLAVVTKARSLGGRENRRCSPPRPERPWSLCVVWIDYWVGGVLWRVLTNARDDEVYKRAFCSFNSSRSIGQCTNFDTGEHYLIIKGNDGVYWTQDEPGAPPEVKNALVPKPVPTR
jgi:hypothetical protein